MTHVIHSPRERVFIHELAVYPSAKALVDTIFGNAPPGSQQSLSWVDGVLIFFVSMPMTDFISKEVVEGRLHWDHASVAPMTKYTSKIEAGKGVVISVIDVSRNETFRDIGKFLKSELKA